MELAKEPGPGISPMALGRCARDAEHLGGLFQAAPREEAELDDLGLLRVQGLQSCQGLVEGEEVHRINFAGLGQFGQVDALHPTATLLRAMATGVVYQDAAHGLCCGGEEVAAVVPARGSPLPE